MKPSLLLIALATACFDPCLSDADVARLEEPVGDFQGVDPAWAPDRLRSDLTMTGVRGLECSEYPCFLIVEQPHYERVVNEWMGRRPRTPLSVSISGTVDGCADVFVPLHADPLSAPQQAGLARRLEAARVLAR